MNQTKTTLNSNQQDAGQNFPADLISKSPEERMKYFRSFTIAHPVLSETFERLWRAVLDPQSGSTILIYGPAGVGKTTLCDYLERRIRIKFAQLFEDNRELIPLVKVEACNPVSGNFDWKHLFREILIGLCEPATGQKLDLTKWRSSCEEYQQVANNPRSACSVMRDVVERALLHRRPKGVLIDEAQHMCVLASGRRLVNQPDSIKSIANRTETTHILFGNYDLLALRNLNGQLARRTIQLHFRRYSNQNAGDVEIFKNVLTQFQSQLPLKKTIDLVANWEFIYSRSIGCIGIVKEWFNRSLSMALDENSRDLNMRHLTASSLSTAQSVRLLDEVLMGEERISNEEISQQSLINRLNFIKVVKPDGRISNIEAKKKPISVGDRKPKRDQVGTGRRYA